MTIEIEYRVYTGRPSWHQARAGASASGISIFKLRWEAEAYLKSFKMHHPDEPAFIHEVEVEVSYA